MSAWRQKWFDLTVGLPVALDVLKNRLPDRWWRVVLRFLWLDVTTNPFAELGRRRLSAGERFTRRQLRPVLVLDRALTKTGRCTDEDRLQILDAIVSETGARFIAANFDPPTPEQWARRAPAERDSFVRRIMSQFQNAETDVVRDPRALAAFDVTRCYFADLARALGRPELGPLFCRADSVFFGRSDVLVRLDRSETIAKGDARCTFRFHFKSD